MFAEVMKGIGVFLLVFSAAAHAATYKHLGCYMDERDNRDLNAKEITYADLSRDDCVSECRKDGYAYAGLQMGERCYCGTSYGKHQLLPAYRCNFTCATGTCGGVLANDVYYTVDNDAGTEANRHLETYDTVKTFNDARRRCVQYGGDLPIVTSSNELDDVTNLATTNGLAGQKIWFGLRKRTPRGDYEWTDETEPVYRDIDFAGFWAQGELFQNPCALIDVDTGEWESTSCFDDHPYVCKQLPQDGNTDDDDEQDLIVVDEDDDGFDKKKLSLYIVLPLMMICYGGSCVAYCIGKLCRTRRKKRREQLLANMEQEYEPHQKPMGRGNKAVAPYPPPPTRTPVESMPSTSREDMTGRQSAAYYGNNSQEAKYHKIREEQRRRQLIEQALEEARQKRLSKKAKKYATGDGSPDPILPGEKKPPMQMSIAEIMKIKKLLNKDSRKPSQRKIISA